MVPALAFREPNFSLFLELGLVPAFQRYALDPEQGDKKAEPREGDAEIKAPADALC